MIYVSKSTNITNYHFKEDNECLIGYRVLPKNINDDQNVNVDSSENPTEKVSNQNEEDISDKNEKSLQQPTLTIPYMNNTSTVSKKNLSQLAKLISTGPSAEIQKAVSAELAKNRPILPKPPPNVTIGNVVAVVENGQPKNSMPVTNAVSSKFDFLGQFSEVFSYVRVWKKIEIITFYAWYVYITSFVSILWIDLKYWFWITKPVIVMFQKLLYRFFIWSFSILNSRRR